MDIHVTNLSFKVTEEELKELFLPFGPVSSVHIVIDRRTRLKKGYAFVTMPSSEDAQVAILKLNGAEIDGRAISLSEAESKPGGKKAFRAKKGVKKKMKILTYDGETSDKIKNRKKRRGQGRSTKY